MNTKKIDKKAITVLRNWDPFHKGTAVYDEEITNVVEALHQFDHPVDLAKKIREIYEHSFEIWIPIEECVQISYKLLAIKYEALSIV